MGGSEREGEGRPRWGGVNEYCGFMEKCIAKARTTRLRRIAPGRRMKGLDTGSRRPYGQYILIVVHLKLTAEYSTRNEMPVEYRRDEYR